MLNRLRQLEEAEKWNELVQQSILLLQQKDRPAEAWGYYARGQLALGNYSAAAGGYQKALLTDDAEDLLLGYAQALLVTGDIEQAKQMLGKLSIKRVFIAETLFMLAIIAREEGEFQEGVALLQQIKDRSAEQGLLLGHLYRDQQLYTEAMLSYQDALRSAPQHQILQQSIQDVLKLHQGSLSKENFHQESKMRRRLEKTWNEIQELPEGSPSRIHMQQALGNQNPVAPPQGYVSELFDQYADRFEDHLLDCLSYQAPQMVAAVIAKRYSAENPAAEILDLGAGTGLLAELVSEIADRLIAVDLSEKMLQRAEEKRLYQQLVQKDLVGFLQETEEQFQVIVATDTLVYLGDLRDFIAGVAARLKKTGHCILTIEKGIYEDYQLHFSGRYRHSLDYLHRLAWENDLIVSRSAEVKLRKGGGDWVQGMILVLEHRS